MSKRLVLSLLALATTLGSAASTHSSAQTRRARASTPTATATRPSPLNSLPASDAVLLVDAKRLLNDALPRVLAGDPARLAKVNAEVDGFKTRYGVDARSFDRIAVGMSFDYPSPGVTKAKTVVVAQGTFNTGALLTAGRVAMQGKFREDKHKGKTIYVFSINDQVKVLGLFNMRVSDLAVAALDANTLALGDLAGVRAVVDAGVGRGRVAPALIALATSNPNAIIGFGANVPPTVLQNLKFGDEATAKTLAAIRQTYGAVSMTGNNLDLLAVARTGNAAEAKSLSDTLLGLKQLGAIFAGQLSGERGRLAQSALENLRITTRENALQINLGLPEADVTALLRIF